MGEATSLHQIAKPAHDSLAYHMVGDQEPIGLDIPRLLQSPLLRLLPFFPKSGLQYLNPLEYQKEHSRTDTWAKAKGLAAFADEHGLQFGRLIVARKKKDQWEFADVNDKATREKARRMQSSSDLESLFAKLS
jgi:hypothetical protein